MKECNTYYPLGSVCTSVNGYTPSAELLNTHGRYPYFKVAEMNLPANQKVMTETTAFVDNPTKIYRKGTVVFPKNGAAISTNKKRILGQDSVIDLNTGGFVVSEDIINVMYFYYIMQHIDFRDYVRRGAVPTLDIKELKSKLIPVPSLSEQEHIVAELDLLNDIIEKKEAQLKELDNLAQSIFYDMFGDPIANEKRWEKVKIGSFSKCVAGATPSTRINDYWENGTIPWLSSGEVSQGRIYSTEAKITQLGYDNASTKLIPAHTVLIALAGQGKTRGTVGVAEIPLCTNQSICSIITNGSIVVDFLYYQLKYLYYELRSISNGDGGRGGLNLKLIQNYEIVNPPLDLQHSFATRIEAIEKQKSTIQKSIEDAQALFNSRMDYYFN